MKMMSEITYISILVKFLSHVSSNFNRIQGKHSGDSGRGWAAGWL